MSLHELTIEAIRGASRAFTLEFVPGKRMTVLYGENGTGKSTICDALEFLSVGSISSLTSRGLGVADRYEHAIGRSRGDMAVTLVTSKGSCTATIVGKNHSVSGGEHLPRVNILRRDAMLRLLEAKPAERYEQIARFIDVGGIEKAEGTLREQVRKIESERERVFQQISGQMTFLVQLCVAAGEPATQALKWAQERTAADPDRLIKLIDQLTLARDLYRRLREQSSSLAEAREATIVQAATVAAASDALTREAQKAVANALELQALLAAGSEYFEKVEKPESCPLCESTSELENLKAKVEARLTLFSDLQKVTNAFDSAKDASKAGTAKLGAALDVYARIREEFSSLATMWIATPDASLPPEPPLDDTLLKEWVLECLPHDQAWEASLKSLQQTRDLSGALQNHSTSVATHAALGDVLASFQRAEEIVRTQRLNFTDTVLKEIGLEVERLYELVHPGEGIGHIRLQLDSKRRASLDVTGRFGGADNVPPGAYFSQSHLDTLGLCIYLALAKREGAENQVLVLDDVLTSVDEPHIERIIGMLHDETADFLHCIVTTHYGPWRHKLRWGWLKNGQCHLAELGGWTLEEGMRLVSTLSELDRLRKGISAHEPDLQAIVSKAGVVLEALLDFLTLQYGCKVPRRVEGRHTLGDLLPSINKKLAEALRTEVRRNSDEEEGGQFDQVVLGPLLGELQQIAQVRNLLGAHFTELSFQMLDSDATRFANLVLNLADAIVDGEGNWPRSKRSGSYWATPGESRRLHPLEQPT